MTISKLPTTSFPTLCTLALLLLLATPPRLHAQSSDDPDSQPPTVATNRVTGGGTVAARALANAINDPTAPLTLVQFRDVVAPTVPGADGPANVLQLEPVFPIMPTRFMPLTELIKITFPLVATAPNPGGATGLGDLSLFDLFTVKQSWGKWGFGPALVFPTATSTVLGQGKWQAGPSFAAIYTGIENLSVGAVLQNPISFAGDSSRPTVNSLIITPTLTYSLPHGWFAGFDDFDLTFDWENGGAPTIPVGVQVGKVFSIGKQPVTFSVEGAYNVLTPSGTATPHWLIGIEFTMVFGTKK
jgi:hypothetical protein